MSFLRGKHAWEGGETDRALTCLDAILRQRDPLPTFDVPSSLAESFEAAPFESFIAALLATDEFMRIPFSRSVQRLWEAAPAQFLLHVLEQRQIASRDLKEAEAVEVVYQAAAKGVLSGSPFDHELVARMVLRREDHPYLARVVDREMIDRLSTKALEVAAWKEFITSQPVLTTNLFLYTVFHKARTMSRSMVLDGLTRLSERQPHVLTIASRTLSEWVDRAGASEVVTIGLRSVGGSAQCLAELAAAIRRRDFDALPATCLPEESRS